MRMYPIEVPHDGIPWWKPKYPMKNCVGFSYTIQDLSEVPWMYPIMVSDEGIPLKYLIVKHCYRIMVSDEGIP